MLQNASPYKKCNLIKDIYLTVIQGAVQFTTVILRD